MTGQTRIKHALDLGMRLQHLSDSLSRAVGLTHPQAQGLHAPGDEECCVGIQRSPGHVAHLLSEANEMSRAGDQAAEYVVVATEIFGGTVHHQINTKVVGTTVDRSGEGGVYQGAGATILGFYAS